MPNNNPRIKRQISHENEIICLSVWVGLPQDSGEPLHFPPTAARGLGGNLLSRSKACWCSYLDSVKLLLAAACCGPQTHSCSLASLSPLHAATHTPHGREVTGVAVMYPVNVIEVRIWLQILPDLHWPFFSWKTVGRGQWGLGQAQGTISAPHRHNFPDVQGPEVLLAARLAMLQPPEEGEKRSAKQSSGKKRPPLPDEQPGRGMGTGVEDNGGLTTLCSPRDHPTPSVLVRGILRAKPHSVPSASGVSVRLGSTLNPNLGCVAQELILKDVSFSRF